jgi:hypothetical protein
MKAWPQYVCAYILGKMTLCEVIDRPKIMKNEKELTAAPDTKTVKPDDESSGQNPAWPGDKTLHPGEPKPENPGEKTVIPLVR